jgi:thioredoxin-dependent peroxiredoxin
MKNEIKLGSKAKDFELTDVDGNKIKLSDYRGKKNVVLVFNRGFA